MKFSTLAKYALTGVALSAAAMGVVAQTSTTAPMGSTQTPAAVGVTPQTATDANRQAVPRSDTGTVVRTGPNAVDSAKSAARAATGSMSNMGSGTTSGMGSGSTSGSSSGMGSGSASGSGSSVGAGSATGSGGAMRPPKADRN